MRLADALLQPVAGMADPGEVTFVSPAAASLDGPGTAGSSAQRSVCQPVPVTPAPLFRRLAIEMLVVCLGVAVRTVDDGVAMIRWRIERI